MLTQIPKISPKFSCTYCNIHTNSKKDFNNHLLTAKHARQSQITHPLTPVTPISPTLPGEESTLSCKLCKKVYKSRVGLWKHAKTCKPVASTDAIPVMEEEILLPKEWFVMLMKQNNEILEFIKSGANITITNK
jgi:hypothetical protein